MSTIGLLVFAALLPAPALAEQASEEAAQLIDEGVRRHDQGDHQGAVEAYQRALRLEPGNPLALYELGQTYLVVGEYAKCLEAADKTLAAKPPPTIEPMAFALAGSCLSSAGKPKKALARFRRGLEAYPEHPSLNFNVAVTLLGQGDNAQAVTHLQRTIEARPEYPSPYYVLGEALQRQGRRVASLLYFMRFIALEPNGDRATVASRAAFALLASGTSEDAPGQITVTVPSGSMDDALGPLEMFLSLASAHMFLESERDKPEAQRQVDALVTFVQMLAESSGEETQTLWRQAAAALVDLQRGGHFETLAYLMATRVGLDGSASWLQAHGDRVRALERAIGHEIRPLG